MLSVGNLTEWVELALTSAKIPAGAALLGDPRPVSTPELVTRLAEGLGLPARLVPFPPKLLLGAGKLLGRGEDVSRLIEDLEVEPSFDAFDSRPVLVDPAAALQEVGKSLRESSGQAAPGAE
jgi:UDP-glucose 4-epimerase